MVLTAYARHLTHKKFQKDRRALSVQAAATDNTDPPPSATCAPASDSLFPIGTTVVIKAAIGCP